jgi:hypothetical protein
MLHVAAVLGAILMFACAALGQGPWALEDGGYVPSGWMGDGERSTVHVQVQPMDPSQPHSEPYCQKWSYRPGSKGWAAVAWQYPENNWGDKPGKNLSGKGYTRVSVWARGLPDAQGRYPVVQFKAGGNTDPTKKYQATFEVNGEFTTLTGEWKQYTLPLAGQDLSNVASAFTFILRASDNPRGATFYLDDIEYLTEPGRPPRKP